MGEQDTSGLAGRLETYGPASVLAIGAGADALLTEYGRAHPESRIVYLDPEGNLEGEALLDALSEQGRFDFVLLRGVLDRIDEDAGAHLMARLRDLHAPRFCVALGDNDGTGHHWSADELVAMGLGHWSTERQGDTTLEIYGFDIGNYKATPDWLNARHWAHPEHWGKFRW